MNVTIYDYWQAKKRRRDIFKDFVKSLSSDESGDGLLLAKSIQDIPAPPRYYFRRFVKNVLMVTLCLQVPTRKECRSN